MRFKFFCYEVSCGMGFLEKLIGDFGEDCDVGDSFVGVGEFISKVI